MMETQADQLASDFLVPPQYDLNRLAELYTEAGRRVAPEEHAWRFLRPLFPDTTEQLGWSNYDRMSAQARADLNVAVDSPESLMVCEP